jgi:hypothetical protein
MAVFFIFAKTLCMDKAVLALGFSKKNQKYLQQLLPRFTFFFEKTKKGTKTILKKEKVHLILIHSKEECFPEWINYVKKYRPSPGIEIWLYSPAKPSLLIRAYKTGIDDFIDADWDDLIKKVKMEHFLKHSFLIPGILEKKIKLGSLIINPKKNKVTKKGKELDLTKIELELLKLLVSDRSKIFTRQEIYHQIWGDDIIVGDRTLDVHMNNLRKKIGKDYVVTKKGIGFGINPDLKV